ncbi:MAG: Crp/Fnr family transcriptional regulator [Desulfitobacterium sp.]
MKLEQHSANILANSLFSSYTSVELTKLLASEFHEIKDYEKGEVVHLQNDLCHTLDIVLEGNVSVEKTDENGNLLIINTFTKGGILGANLLFSGRNHYPMTISAATKSTILHIRKVLIIDICQKDIDFMTNLMKIISNTSTMLVDKIDMISHKTIRKSITEFLKHEYKVQKNTCIKLKNSKKELAEKLGIQRSSLSRELSKMRNAGLVEYDAKTITIMDLSIVQDNY